VAGVAPAQEKAAAKSRVGGCERLRSDDTGNKPCGPGDNRPTEA
jgi:hypothetical protein